jgi:rod shape determining protein RodA
MLLTTFILILKQPDLGTAIIILMSGLLLLMQAKFPIKWLLITLLCCITCMPIAWHMLKPYQQQRVLVFLGHGDAQKERYQIEQSKIAIGSGGLYGKGYQQGTQNIFQFLPESRTDFIFAIIAEEWGFVGALFVLSLFLLLILRIISVITTITNQSIQLLAFGIGLHITLSLFINICMVLGLLPIVGIPLPLISYGLSNLWVVLATLGILNNIAMHRFDM